MAEDNKKTTYPLIFNGKTYDVKPGNVAIFTIKTNQVDLLTAARQVRRINKKLINKCFFWYIIILYECIILSENYLAYTL